MPLRSPPILAIRFYHWVYSPCEDDQHYSSLSFIRQTVLCYYALIRSHLSFGNVTMDGFSMNSFSANGSQYAPRSYSGNSESARAVGTWKCPVCDSRNPIRRPDCLSCSGGTSSENKPRVSGQSRLSYTHPHAHPAVDSRVEHARPNGVEHDQPTTDDILNGATSVNHPPRLQVREPGLAMSRWAPPGYVRGHNYNNNWVKVCPYQVTR